MPFGNQCLRLVVTRLRGVEERFRRVAIHQDFAGDDQEIARCRFLEQRIDRLRMHRAEHQRGGRSVAQEFVAKDARGGARKFLVGESLLSRIGVAIQPIQQLRALRADDSGLHEMDMRIDEARRDQVIAIVSDDCTRTAITFFSAS